MLMVKSASDVVSQPRTQHRASEPDRSIGSGQSHKWYKIIEFSTDLWKNLWKTHQIVENFFSTGSSHTVTSVQIRIIFNASMDILITFKIQ
jgi:hypothetical protein